MGLNPANKVREDAILRGYSPLLILATVHLLASCTGAQWPLGKPRRVHSVLFCAR
jgi:hypothetical protein